VLEAAHRFGSVNNTADRPHGFVHDQLHADRRGEMKNIITRTDGDIDRAFAFDRITDEMKSRISPQTRKVFFPTRGKVIKDRHIMPISEQALHQVRTDEPRPAGDEITFAHWRSISRAGYVLSNPLTEVFPPGCLIN
jgi:hypothetical protein